MVKEKDEEIKELKQRVKAVEKNLEKLNKRPSMYELMGMTDPNSPWIGEKYREIQKDIESGKLKKESPIAKGEIVVKKKEDIT